jgi:hypothetical protein
MKFAVLIIHPPGYQHSECFREVAETIHFGLLRLGHDSVLTDNTLISGRQHIVLGSNLIGSYPIWPPEDSVLYNLEQIKDNHYWVNGTFPAILRDYSAWDYSSDNKSELKKLGITVEAVLPIGYSDRLTRIAKVADPDIDVLFIGSCNDRRLRLLERMRALGLNVVHLFGKYGEERDSIIGRAKLLLNAHLYKAKILEIVRISYYLANGCAVLSEFGGNPDDDRQFEGGVAFAEYDDLPARALELCENRDVRLALAQRGFEIMRARPIEPLLEAALAVNARARIRRKRSLRHAGKVRF